MSWEQSRRPRTIATSRSDDNRDEARNRDNEKNAGVIATNEPEEFETSPGAPLTEPPGGKPFPLDKLFQERTDTPTQLALVDVSSALYTLTRTYAGVSDEWH